LPLLDNYERAVGSSQDNKDPKIENFLNGFRMLLVPTREALKREGLEEIKITPQKDL
jgi:molecular chaperone GrpE (heat shock protein)